VDAGALLYGLAEGESLTGVSRLAAIVELGVGVFERHVGRAPVGRAS